MACERERSEKNHKAERSKKLRTNRRDESVMVNDRQ